MRKALSPLTEEVLTNEQAYCGAIEQLPRLSREEEQDCLTRARAGDVQARDALILTYLRYIRYLARQYVAISDNPRIEFLDVVSVGSLAMLECFDKALAQPNPIGYLRVVAKHAMLHYCERSRTMIEPGRTHTGYEPEYEMVSVDVPVDVDKEGEAPSWADVLQAPSDVYEERDYSWLHTAVARLPALSQEVIERHYGMGYAPESLFAIGMELYQGDKPTGGRGYAYRAHERGIRQLRQQLVTQEVA